jgi:hypothetical protein
VKNEPVTFHAPTAMTAPAPPLRRSKRLELGPPPPKPKKRKLVPNALYTFPSAGISGIWQHVVSFLTITDMGRVRRVLHRVTKIDVTQYDRDVLYCQRGFLGQSVESLMHLSCRVTRNAQWTTEKMMMTFCFRRQLKCTNMVNVNIKIERLIPLYKDGDDVFIRWQETTWLFHRVPHNPPYHNLRSLLRTCAIHDHQLMWNHLLRFADYYWLYVSFRDWIRGHIDRVAELSGVERERVERYHNDICLRLSEMHP